MVKTAEQTGVTYHLLNTYTQHPDLARDRELWLNEWQSWQETEGVSSGSFFDKTLGSPMMPTTVVNYVKQEVPQNAEARFIVLVASIGVITREIAEALRDVTDRLTFATPGKAVVLSACDVLGPAIEKSGEAALITRHVNRLDPVMAEYGEAFKLNPTKDGAECLELIIRDALLYADDLGFDASDFADGALKAYALAKKQAPEEA